jgi:hypothetical protein
VTHLRRWLILAYTLSTLVATLGHDHHREPEALFAEAGCDDSRAHLASHDAPDHSKAFNDCPICQYRTGPQIAQAQASFDPGATTSDEVVGQSVPEVVLREIHRFGTRAPPQA